MTEAPATIACGPASVEDPLVATLVDRAVTSHDQAAFGQLFDRFAGQIYRYLYARCGQHADAEDLTGQVFLHAWEAIGGFRWQGRPFVAWLYRLAHNAHIDQVRRQRPTLSFDDEADLPQWETTTGSASDVIDQVDAQVVALAVRQLTPKQRQVIHLRFTADLDTSAIAEIMGEREGAIRALQLRALLSLRRVLDAEAAFEDRQSFTRTRAPGG